MATRRITKILPRFYSFSKENNEYTHFGYKTVPISEKSTLVSKVFENVAERYDLMNDAMSLGLHRCWKNRFVSILSPRPGMRLLDVAGGTGDISFRFLNEYSAKRNSSGNSTYSMNENASNNPGNTPKVTIVDINTAMLRVGEKRACEVLSPELCRLIEWKCGDAENLIEIDSSSFDAYSIAFGVRNCTSITRVLSEAYRVLVPGGIFACLEFSPKLQDGIFGDIFQPFYDFYSFYGIPALGTLITGKSQPYEYFVESIRKFPPRKTFAAMIENAGFSHVHIEPLTGGICAIHVGIKLPSK